MPGRLSEWVIRVGFAVLCLTALWTVFGDDVAALISAEKTELPKTQNAKGNR